MQSALHADALALGTPNAGRVLPGYSILQQAAPSFDATTAVGSQPAVASSITVPWSASAAAQVQGRVSGPVVGNQGCLIPGMNDYSMYV